MPRYFYVNECLTGVLDVSDYGFSCVIEALDKPTALEWGHHVAKVYNDRFGLLPRGGRLHANNIEHNGRISTWNPKDDEFLDKHHFCRVGELPEFRPGSAPVWDTTWTDEDEKS